MSKIAVFAPGLQPGDVLPYSVELGYVAEVLDAPKVQPQEDGFPIWYFPVVTYTPNGTGTLESGFDWLALPTGLVEVIRPEGSPWT